MSRAPSPPRLSLARRLAGMLLGLVASDLGQAYELYNRNGSVLNADLEAMFGIMHSSKNYNWYGNRDSGGSSWREGYIKYGLSGSQALGRVGTLYGAVSMLSSATWGEGDAAGYTLGNERRTALEDAYLGWRSANLFPMLGDDGVDISFGRQVVKVGDGFLLFGDMLNIGNVDLGGNYNRGGAYYIAARKAFDKTFVLRLGGEDGWRSDLMWLKSDNRAQAEAEMTVVTLEHIAAPGTLGLTWIHGLDVNERYAGTFLSERKGMDTVSLRGTGNLGVSNLHLSFEYANQDKHSGRESAWYVEGGWTFAALPWSPTLTYRYSHFSEQYDYLFYGMSRGYGTWYQGEVAGNYGGPFNSNARVHHVGLKASPREGISLGALFFDFETIDRSQGDSSGRELDLYAEWQVNEHLMVSPVLGFYKPQHSAANGGLQIGDNDVNVYSQLIMATFF